MSKLLKTLRRTVVLKGWTNRLGRRALREIEKAYREMLQVMTEYAVKHKASQSTLHRIFYHKFKETYPWLPTRVIKGCYRDAVRRARSFREMKRRGVARTERLIVRRVTVTYSDSQDWRVRNGVIELRTHRGWIEIHYRGHKQLHRYLYGGWRLAQELRLKLVGKIVLLYLTFTKDFEVMFNPDNVIAVDFNENNVTLAVFRGRKLREVCRVETNLGRMVIAYTERGKRITSGGTTTDRAVKKALRGLRERKRKHDVIHKVAKLVEELSRENEAVVVVGNAYRGKRRMMDRARRDALRHRICQMSMSMLVKTLKDKLLHVVEVSEAYTSSRDPFSGKPIHGFSPSVICLAVRGRKRVRAIKIQLRLAKVSNGMILDRDVIGAINIGLKYLSSDGRGMAFPSTEPHGVQVKLMILHGGLAQTTELKVIKTT